MAMAGASRKDHGARFTENLRRERSLG